MDIMEFTFFQNHRDKGTDRTAAMTWAEILSFLSTHRAREDKDGPGFSPAKFAHTPCQCGASACTYMRGHAINANVIESYMMAIDLDKGADGADLTEAEARRHIETLKATGLAFVAHTTYSYAPPDKSTWHVFLPFSRPVKPDEYRRVWKAAKAWLNIPSGITTDFPARFWNAPSCPFHAARDVVVQSGPHLDVDLLLDLSPDEPGNRAIVARFVAPSEFGPADEATLAEACKTLDGLGDAIEGQGGDVKTFKAACHLVNDWALDVTEAWAVFQAWNAKCCKPTWDENALQYKLDKAIEAGEKSTEPRGQKRSDFECFRALDARQVKKSPFLPTLIRAKEMWLGAMVQDETPREPKPWFMTGPELEAMVVPKTPWLISGLVTKGGVGVIATEPKAGKTWVATEYCVAVATGTKCFGEYETEQGTAAYFYAEDMQTSVRARARALLKHDPARGYTLPDAFRAQPRGETLNLLDDSSVIQLLASALDFPNLKLLVLDPLRDVHTGAEDSSDEMSKVTKRLRILSSLLDCTVIFVHHTAKGGVDVNGRRHGQRMRGSGAIHGAIDHALYLYDSVSDGDQIINTCSPELKAARAAPAFALTLDIEDDPETQTAIGAKWSTAAPGEHCDDEGVSEVIEEIGRALMRREDPPMERDLQKILGGSKAAIVKTLKVAESMGLVTRNRVGSVSRGWVLTQQGHQNFNGILRATGIPGPDES